MRWTRGLLFTAILFVSVSVSAVWIASSRLCVRSGAALTDQPPAAPQIEDPVATPRVLVEEATLEAPQGGSVSNQAAEAVVRVSETLLARPIVQQWRAEGVTDEDLLQATKNMQEQGFPPNHWDDVALIFQFLPRHNIEPLRSGELSLPATASSGFPVAFKASGMVPDSSFTFEAWDIKREGDVITIRLIGSKSGKPAPMFEVPLTAEGVLPPLDPGIYTVQLSRGSTNAVKTLTVQ